MIKKEEEKEKGIKTHKWAISDVITEKKQIKVKFICQNKACYYHYNEEGIYETYTLKYLLKTMSKSYPEIEYEEEDKYEIEVGSQFLYLISFDGEEYDSFDLTIKSKNSDGTIETYDLYIQLYDIVDIMKKTRIKYKACPTIITDTVRTKMYYILNNIKTSSDKIKEMLNKDIKELEQIKAYIDYTTLNNPFEGVRPKNEIEMRIKMFEKELKEHPHYTDKVQQELRDIIKTLKWVIYQKSGL